MECLEVAPGQNIDNVETQLPCEPSELPKTDIGRETIQKAEEEHEKQRKQQEGNYQRCGFKFPICAFQL